MKKKQGDRMVMVTDGLVEARNRSDEQYNTPRLKKLLEENRKTAPDKIGNLLFNDVNTFCEGLPADDDRAFICLDFNGK